MHLRIIALLAVLAVAASAQSTVRVNAFSTGTPDYVELQNCGSTPVDVSGWTVGTFYSLGAGALAETPFVLPGAPNSGATVIPANGFLLLQEFGTAGMPGTLPNSISVGFNYFWVQARTTGVWITDASGTGIDYVYRDFNAEGGTPMLPAGTGWIGTYTGGTTDFSERVMDGDTDSAADWADAPIDTANALNAGQVGGCVLPPAEYETNDAAASLDLDGVTGTILFKAVTTVMVGQTVTLNVDSTLTGNPFDVGITIPETLVPLSGGGLGTVNGQIVNLDIAAPSLLFLFGGSISNPFGGVFPGNLALPFVAPVPVTASAQMLIVDAANPDGFSLSQGAELAVLLCMSSSNFDSLSTGTTLELGWVNGAGSNLDWTVDDLGTGSLDTGPTAAFSGPNYLYCETSVSHPATFAFDTCAINAAALVNNRIDFQLSRIGATMGTLEVQIDDGLSGTFVTIPGGTFSGPDPLQSQGGIEWSATSVPLPSLASQVFAVRFFFTTTTSFTSDVAIDDLTIN